MLLQRGHTRFLKTLGTPFTSSQFKLEAYFSYTLYKLALRNKVALSYLSHYSTLNFSAKRLYAYHRSRHERLLDILCNVCEVLDKHSFSYAVFKTLKPFDEDVTDIDVIYLSSDPSGYEELVKALESAGYVIMERSFYCTTFMDARYRYVTELIYTEGLYIAALGAPQAIVASRDLKHWYPLHVEGYGESFNHHMSVRG